MRGEEGIVRLFFADAAVLETRETRTDIPCHVEPVKPTLGFDLKFHAGYDVSIPLKELTGNGGLLTMVYQVTPEDHPDAPVYMLQRVTVPEIEEDAKGEAAIHGVFDVGEGKYRVSWLMRDRLERVCSNNWEMEASIPVRDREMALDITADAVQAADVEQFKEDPPVQRDARGGPLNLKVILNFAPQESTSAALQPVDLSALVWILRNMDRDPRVGKFSVVAFNMQQQRVLYRQDEASQIDFPALGEAVKSLKLGTVDLRQLAEKNAGVDFLTGLFTKEIKDDSDPPDAVIIAGPKVDVDGAVSQDALRDMGDVKFPVYYMNYNLEPQVNPWRDAIGTAVRYLKGVEYTISRPRDLFFAWSEIVGRIVISKIGATVAGNTASQ